MRPINFFITVLLSVTSLQCSAGFQNTGNKIPDSYKDTVIKTGECGGTIELDKGTFVYPGEGSIQPGELCVWTIHLKTMQGFRVNFTSLNIPGEDSDCTASAVGIYGLSNLISQGNEEGYRLCNENNGVGNYFLTSNIVTVSFYTSTNVPPNNPDFGFSFHWEGISFQPIPTEHSSTYSISPTGIIWYPFEGEYLPNVAMTWLVKGVPSNEIGIGVVDIDVIFVNLESCSFSDKCLCDAVIIYEVSLLGNLLEVDRFCGNKTHAQYHSVNNNFIVALFTDQTDTPNEGYGFQVVWRQGTGHTTTTTTTTEMTTTTTEMTTTEELKTTTEFIETTTEEQTTTVAPPEIHTCGGIIEGDSGIISYKSGQRYDNNERCIWTIRLSPSYTEMDIKLLESGFQLGSDYVSVFSFVQRTGLVDSVNLGKSSNGYEEARVTGSVAVVVFSSDKTTTGNGFRLYFAGRGNLSPSVTYFHDFRETHVVAASLRYPSSGQYHNGELSTFVITKGVKYDYHPYEKIGLTVQALYIQSCGRDCSCDGILIYELNGDRLRKVHDPMCGVSAAVIKTVHTFIVVFYSDHTTRHNPLFLNGKSDHCFVMSYVITV